MDDRLEKIVRRVFKITDGPINENWTSVNISEWDSLGHLNFIMEIEKEFDIKVEIEEMFEIQKLSDINKILKKHNIKN